MPQPNDTYSSGYDQQLVQQLQQRTLTTEAAFFLPHLQAGLSVLDCGCGPGTLTHEIAQVVAPARVVGLDVAFNQVELANKNAPDHASFAQGSAYKLPFPDNSFDAVFAHAMLYHLNQPEQALREMHRVLRPNGLIGIRDADFGGSIFSPENDLLDHANQLLAQVIRYNGGNPFFGREQRATLHRAGFVDIQVSASFDVHDTPDKIQRMTTYLANHLTKPANASVFIAQGDTTPAQLVALPDALHKWSQQSNALALHCRMEAIARCAK